MRTSDVLSEFTNDLYIRRAAFDNPSPMFGDDDSCSSPTFHEISKALFNEDTMADCENGGVEDASLVMTRVLAHLERVVDHLRLQGEYQAANSIAKDTISIITTFNEATAPWDIADLTMSAITPPSSNGNQTSSPSSSGTTPSSAQISPSSWAAIAAVRPAVGNRLIKFTPEDAVKTKYVEEKSVSDTHDTDSRVVWIQGWKEERPLGEVTSNIGQGPVYSMAYSAKDDSVCVIFQYASSAIALTEEDAAQVKKSGCSRFGPDCQVLLGQSFPINKDIQRMLIPHNERRRLTFARSQLFTNGLTEAKFRADIFGIVGTGNVEIIWLFNTGNATAVFSAVPIARLVRDEFCKLSRMPGSPYFRCVVSFSHDPCEKPMTLITQMPAGQASRSMGAYGGGGILPSDVVSKGGSSSRRSTTGRGSRDSNGWQTVLYKK